MNLEASVIDAMRDGYKGLWATGDMLWEFGSERNLPKLGEYERRLGAAIPQATNALRHLPIPL